MSMLARLQVHDVTALIRGNDPERPAMAGTNGTRVVLLLDAEHAQELAKVISLGATVGEGDLDRDPLVYDRIATDLIAAANHTTGTVMVPLIRGTAS